jgi:hypothetical protein
VRSVLAVGDPKERRKIEFAEVVIRFADGVQFDGYPAVAKAPA